MKKTLLILLTAILLSATGAKGAITADWKLHLPFDDWATQVVETPNRIYMLARTFEKSTSVASRAVPSHSLFYYDKEGNEIVSVNERINANGNAVACIGYNAQKKYLLVVYTDCNIDFIYDDGRVFNLAALKLTSIPGAKQANSITFDNQKGRAYIATTFGYVALNEDKHEVAESRIYDRDISSIVRSGSNVVLCSEGKTYYAPASSQRFNFNDYTLIEDAPFLERLIPTSGDNVLAYKEDNGYIGRLTRGDDGNFVWAQLHTDPHFHGYQQIANSAVKLTGNVRIYYISYGGELSISAVRDEADYAVPAALYEDAHLWVLHPRKGLKSYDRLNSKWVMTRDFMRPNAPATYISTAMVYHPTYGLLCGSNSQDMALSDFSQKTPVNLSALKNGLWKEYGYPYSGNTTFTGITNYGGVSVDPQNPNHVYRVNTQGGIMRVNLADPKDILIFAQPANRFAGKEGFVEIVNNLDAWDLMCRFSPPQFSTDGTMWSAYYDADAERVQLWYWPAADRLATTSAASYRPMKHINVPEMPGNASDCMITLAKNKNIIALGAGIGDWMMLYDHNGTPDNTSDDRYVLLDNLYDQDGGSVSFLAVNSLYEEPSTGIIWVMTQRGLFTLNPQTAFEDPTRINRIKVARNDGTNLADYLLNEINVHSLSVDGEGRKWFSTSNGLVCTSADGRTILGEFTTENSYLPSDVVYATCYNPENNSMMVATEGGLVEMFPSGSGSSADSGSTMRVYPNPVEPDFYGWVRIDNIPDGSLVKITDSTGGIVKELGPAQGGAVEWDVSNYNHARVSTGVYYIMVSPGNSSGGASQISKILVLN